jgi:hypothetical protein
MAHRNAQKPRTDQSRHRQTEHNRFSEVFTLFTREPVTHEEAMHGTDANWQTALGQ